MAKDELKSLNEDIDGVAAAALAESDGENAKRGRPAAKIAAGFQDRFLQSLRETPYSRKQIADMMHVSYQTILNWGADRGTPSLGNAITLAGFLGVSPSWLISGEGPKFSSSTKLFRLDQQVLQNTVFAVSVAQPVMTNDGCGFRDTEEFEFYTPRFFQDFHIRPENCKVIDVRTDSMAPLLLPGNRVLLDVSTQKPLTQGVYLYALQGVFYLSRIIPHVDGSLTLINLKNEQMPEKLPADYRKFHFRLMGRVIEQRGHSGLELNSV